MHLYWLLAQAEGAEQPFWVTFVPIVFIMVVFYFVLMRPQIKQQKEHQKLIENIKKGDRVITSGGIWGEIDAVEAHSVRLRIADKTKIMISRSNIAGFQPKAGEAPAENK